MSSILRWLLVAVVVLQLVTSADSKKKKKKRTSTSVDYSQGYDEGVTGGDVDNLFDGGIYDEMRRVREKTSTPAERQRFVEKAEKALREFEEMNGQFAPELGPTYAVTPEQVEQFHRDGYVVLRGVFTPEEISFYREAILNTMNLDVHYLTKRPGFLRVYNLWDKNYLAMKFILSERLGRIGADLLQATGARLYQDQTFYKFPGDGESPLHQDNYAAPLDTNQTASMWIPLVPCTKEMGALEFLPGSHRQGQLGQGFNYKLDQLEAHFGPMVNGAADGPLQLGDITVHNGWTIHRADPNLSAGPARAVREAVAIQLFADGTRRNDKPTQSGSYRHDANSMSRWANDFRPGDVIDHHFTPLLFSYEGRNRDEL